MQGWNRMHVKYAVLSLLRVLVSAPSGVPHPPTMAAYLHFNLYSLSPFALLLGPPTHDLTLYVLFVTHARCRCRPG